MNRSYFISDIHLTPHREDITQAFLDFIQNKAVEADALYVLGDLFEAWIGDDDLTRFNVQVIDALQSLVNSGVPVFFIAGNRDFLIGEDFAALSGIRILDDVSKVELYGQPVLISHGDEMCTDDVEYQLAKTKIRSVAWKEKVSKWPLWFRRLYAWNLRRKSKNAQKYKPLEIMDVNQDSVLNAFKQHQVKLMIHGHTHRPNIHTYSTDDGELTRIVLGDWYSQGSVLVVTDKGFDLQSFSL